MPLRPQLLLAWTICSAANVILESLTVVVALYLLSVVLSRQPVTVSPSGGETCHCSEAGPGQQRSAAGYTPHTASTLHPDLEGKKTSRMSPTEWQNYQGRAGCKEITHSLSPEAGICWMERPMVVGVGLSISSGHIPPKAKIWPLSRSWEGLGGVFIPEEEK